ncbi:MULTISPECIES: NAD-dependent epimerase/dehydratase family protein [Empedobacter]|uniref:NAD-dependent epimerase/dehydratase family protein n=1 Tax=Empedobacter TaxID=59734 RepID=UPI00257729CD|nr:MULTISPECIES: NAD-dependent epimerase/dehydratase family protein [Empedobacter]MDM1040619.1 NAD-dependent epimerase/dehydratase family protein [Empedobacter brevis]MDM1135606.1 NAD-dependent epimerase/dehydratase family protein [Empedobacter sp. R750]
MIIGRGLIANLFTEVDLDEVVFFASGVSNSSETRKGEFLREQNLVEDTLANNPEKLFVYFSTCSIYDSSKYNSLYVLHKLHIEEVIKQNTANYLILRISNVVGIGGNPNLLMNYLYRQIMTNQQLNVHKYATRNLIDVEDVKDITLQYIQSNRWNRIVNVAYGENYFIPEIVEAFEEILQKPAMKLMENKGEHYSIDIHELQYQFSIQDKEAYLNNLIKKYYARN